LLFFHLVENDQDQLTKDLIQHGANINLRDLHGGSPLHYAASSGNNRLVGLLVQGGANINSINGKRQTPLHVAVNLYLHHAE
jgi:ankyrin repeat protein